MSSTSHGRNGILFIGRGLAYRKTEEMDFSWSKQGPVDQEGSGVPQNGVNGLVLERYGRNGGPVHREGSGVPQNGTPLDTVHLHSRLPPRATVHPPSIASTGSCSSTIDLLQPPPATVHPRVPVHLASTATPLATIQPALSMGSCSTTPPRATIHPALHRLLFNQPSMGSCSSSPAWGPVHPVSTGSIGVLFIQRQRPLLPWGPLNPPPPQQRSLFIKRQHR